MTNQNQEPKGKLNLHRGHPYKESDGRFRTTILTDDNETYAVVYADEKEEGSSYRAQQIIDALNEKAEWISVEEKGLPSSPQFIYLENSIIGMTPRRSFRMSPTGANFPTRRQMERMRDE